MFTALKKTNDQTKVSIFTSGSEFDTSSVHVLAKNFKNVVVEIRKFDTASLTDYEMSEPANRFPAASMVPLFVPQLVEGKCIFLDADTLVLRDLGQLFRVHLDGCLIGACRSYSHSLSVRRAFHRGYFFPLIYGKRRTKYWEKATRLGYSTISELEDKFFSSGVILYDTDAIRAADPSHTLSNMDDNVHLWTEGYILPDMDKLNQFFKDKVYYLDQKWDVPRDVSSLNKLYARPDLWHDIRTAINDPSILHFSGIYMRKSWKRPWYKGSRYRLYRRTCQEIHMQTGIDVATMFDARE